MEKTKTLPKTHWKKLYNSNYLGAWSIEEGKDIVLTISSVQLDQVFNQTENQNEDCTVINWVENEFKPMIVNKTNAETISSVIGSPYIEDWQGKKIQIYVAQIKAFGSIHDALRVRPKAPRIKKEQLTPDHKMWDKAMSAMCSGNTNIDAIRKKYELSEDHAKLLTDAKMA